MNGPEHYREAERLLEHADHLINRATVNTWDEAMEAQPRILAAAQVHATLALAAATAEQAAARPLPASDGLPATKGNEWGRLLAGIPEESR